MRRSLAVTSLCAALLAAGPARASTAADLAATARFLAGKSAPSDAHARNPSYLDHAAQLAIGWRQFQQPNLERMRSWWTGRGPATYATVFYPFSGPDIANALALFPDADSYVLFGLEPPGAIPDVRSMSEEAIASGLNDLKASLGTILQVNYFFTRAMEKKLGHGSFSSIAGLLFCFLAMSDREVTGARRIAIGRGGAIVTGSLADDTSGHRRVPGVEITFRSAGGTPQTLRYFMANVSDRSLAKTSPDFIAYLKSQGRFATMIKSASYLMHKDGIEESARFDQIRALILLQSDFLVQDDSGVPLRLFARDAWKLQFHGRYVAPTPEFGKHLQQDLKVEMHRNSTGRLPFSYGYAYKAGESNLMTAERVR